MNNGVNRAIKAGIVLAIFAVAIPICAWADGLTVSARRVWNFQGATIGFWGVRLTFDRRVFPSNLSEHTLVKVDGKQVKFEVKVSSGADPASQPGHTFLIVPAKASKVPESVTITIEKGLSDATGRRLLAKNFTYQFISIEKIIVSDISTYYRTQTDQGLTLRVSDHISQKDLADAVEIIPSVPNLKVTRVRGWRYRITGDFEPEQEYVLKIAKKTVSKGKGELSPDEFAFKGPGPKSSVEPNTKRSVVELLGRQLFPLTVTHAAKIRCTLRRVPPLLLPDVAAKLAVKAVLKDDRWASKSALLKSLAEAGKVNPVFLADATEESEVFFVPEAKEQVKGYSLPLSFREHPKKGGAWILSLVDLDSKFHRQIEEPIQITDLSVSYKYSAESLLLWVTSIYSGKPVAGVEVMLYQPHGTWYAVGKTDGQGLLMIEDGREFPAISIKKKAKETGKKPLALAEVTRVLAATENDSCHIALKAQRLKPYAVTQAKSVKDKAEFMRGYVFTERGVYRPGATVHFKAVSRVFKDRKISSPAGQKMKVTITDPRGDIQYSKVLTLGEFGTCYDTFPTKTFFPVGTYTIRVRPEKRNDSKRDFTQTFMLQDFKRARHFATVNIKRMTRDSDSFVGLDIKEDFLDVEIGGQYYTGGPVKHGRVRWKASLVSVENRLKGLGGYFFGNEDETTRFLESGESTLDRNGKLQLTIPLDPKLLTGIYGVRISATVLDVDGEPATEVQTYSPRPKYLVGISRHPTQVQAGYASPLRVIVVDRDGKKLSAGTVRAEIMKETSYYVRKRDRNGNINHLWERGWMKSLSVEKSIINGEATFQLDLNRAGDYLVAFTYTDQSERYTSQTIFRVGWESYDEWVQRRDEKDVRTSNEIPLSLSKKSYAVGESVDVQFNTPRPVKNVLVTFERGGIFEYRLVKVKDGQAGFQFTMKEDFVPNVYVSILAVAGREGFPVYTTQSDDDVPMVYYGYANVSATTKSQDLVLQIAPGIAELKGKPAEKKTLTFKVANRKGKGVKAEMAVCVVDEAVLALTRFLTPSLSTLTGFNLPLSVFSGDLRLSLVSQDLYRILTTKPLTGGGMGAGLVGPSLRKDFRPVAYFNPAVITSDSGEATVEFTLPDTTTAYRVYAVVCNEGAGFVSGQRNMVVTKEFFIEPSVPRFLIPGDRVIFPVVLNNKTKEKGEFSLVSESSRSLDLTLPNPSGSLEPWSTSVLKASADVTSGIEEGRVLFKGEFTTKSAQYDDAIQQKIPILSRYLPVFRAQMGGFTRSGEIEAKFPKSLQSFKTEDLNPADFKAALMLSMTNWSKVAPGLKYLLRYPYGCVEQTSSGIIPLAGVRALAKAGNIPGITEAQVDKYLAKGVARLLSMQTISGGFAYWPGNVDPSWWGTMYATFALIMAKEGGYEVPEARLKRALKYLRKNLFDPGKDEYHSRTWTTELAFFNLAMGDQLSDQELARLFENYESLSDQSKALLLLAASKIDYLSKKELVDKVKRLDPRNDPKRTDYSNSSYREIAICLLAATEIGGAKAKADDWASNLLAGLKPEGRWNSTADTGWCLLALSKYFEKKDPSKQTKVKVTVDCAGQAPVTVTLTDAASYVVLDPLKLLKQGKINLKSDSKRLVNYSLDLTYPDIVTDPSQLSNGFTLRKTMENLNGNKEIRVGDVIKVTLEIDLDRSSRDYWNRKYEYLALVDPVPAGIVPINSELKSEGVEEETAPDGNRYQDTRNFTPAYSEFRDDGVRVFKNRAWGGLYRYTYLARAVAQGEFWMRASRISLMYNPEIFGRTKGRKVKVLPAK